MVGVDSDTEGLRGPGPPSAQDIRILRDGIEPAFRELVATAGPAVGGRSSRQAKTAADA